MRRKVALRRSGQQKLATRRQALQPRNVTRARSGTRAGLLTTNALVQKIVKVLVLCAEGR